MMLLALALAQDVTPEAFQRVQVTHTVTPEMPQLAYVQGVKGVCPTRVFIDIEGKVSGVQVQDACPELFRESARAAGRQFTFNPMKVEGEPQATTFLLKFQFQTSRPTGEVCRVLADGSAPSCSATPSGFSDQDVILADGVFYPVHSHRKIKNAVMPKGEGACPVEMHVNEDGDVLRFTPGPACPADLSEQLKTWNFEFEPGEEETLSLVLTSYQGLFNR